jgi:hypothetical protein
MQGYSLINPQTARFTHIPADEVYEFLRDDERLHCMEDTPQRAFWLYWGDPAFDTPHGTLCFGDFELQEDHTLLITALSAVRMEMLLDLVRPLNLGTPQRQTEFFPPMEKPPRKASRGKRRRRP